MAALRDDCDLLVVGGGIAGMVAAVAVASAGGSVLVLERQHGDSYVNATRLSGGVFHCGLRDPRTPAEVLERVLAKATQGVSDPALVKVLATDALRTIRWLQDHGIAFMQTGPARSFVLAPPNVSRRGLAWHGRGGDVLLRRLEGQLIENRGEIRRGHEVTDLIMARGQCVGVAGTHRDGPFALYGKNVLIADGGFQSDMDLLGSAISRAPHRLFQRNARSGLGFGLRMARAVGARISPLRGFYGHLQTRDALQDDSLWPYPWWDDVAVQGIVVDGDGKRFCDEGRGGIFIANRVADLADPLSAFVIFDEAIWRSAGQKGQVAANPNFERAGATIHRADTLAAVAAKAGLPADILASEVDAYNRLFAEGRPEPKAVAGATRLPILHGPFYAAPICAGVTYAMGGIVHDQFGRVRDQGDAPIPGLYAAGSTTGGLEGGENAGYVGGLIKSAVMSLRSAEHMLAAMA